MTEVVVVSAKYCDLCERAKEVLARVGADHAIRVRDVSLESGEGRRLALATGAAFPPVILLDGRLFSYGRLSERRLRRELASRSVAKVGLSESPSAPGD